MIVSVGFRDPRSVWSALGRGERQAREAVGLGPGRTAIKAAGWVHGQSELVAGAPVCRGDAPCHANTSVTAAAILRAPATARLRAEVAVVPDARGRGRGCGHGPG